jgi:hypothetical protein
MTDAPHAFEHSSGFRLQSISCTSSVTVVPENIPTMFPGRAITLAHHSADTHARTERTSERRLPIAILVRYFVSRNLLALISTGNCPLLKRPREVSLAVTFSGVRRHFLRGLFQEIYQSFLSAPFFRGIPHFPEVASWKYVYI